MFCFQLLEAQADYHRKSLSVLESVLPTIQAQQGGTAPLTTVRLSLSYGF